MWPFKKKEKERKWEVYPRPAADDLVWSSPPTTESIAEEARRERTRRAVRDEQLTALVAGRAVEDGRVHFCLYDGLAGGHEYEPYRSVKKVSVTEAGGSTHCYDGLRTDVETFLKAADMVRQKMEEKS